MKVLLVSLLEAEDKNTYYFQTLTDFLDTTPIDFDTSVSLNLLQILTSQHDIVHFFVDLKKIRLFDFIKMIHLITIQNYLNKKFIFSFLNLSFRKSEVQKSKTILVFWLKKLKNSLITVNTPNELSYIRQWPIDKKLLNWLPIKSHLKMDSPPQVQKVNYFLEVDQNYNDLLLSPIYSHLKSVTLTNLLYVVDFRMDVKIAIKRKKYLEFQKKYPYFKNAPLVTDPSFFKTLKDTSRNYFFIGHLNLLAVPLVNRLTKAIHENEFLCLNDQQAAVAAPLFINQNNCWVYNSKKLDSDSIQFLQSTLLKDKHHFHQKEIQFQTNIWIDQFSNQLNRLYVEVKNQNSRLQFNESSKI